MALIDALLCDIATEGGKSAFISTVESMHNTYKSKKEWKKLFVNTGEFFVDHERNSDKIFDDLDLVLSKTNMEKVAKEFDKESGYELKNRLLNSLISLMKQYDIPHDIAYSYSYRFLSVILNEMQKSRPEKYDQHYQAEWRKQEQKDLAEIKDQIDKVRDEVKQFGSMSLGIRSAEDMELELRSSSKDIKVGIDFFEIDDESFKEQFNEQRNNKVICIRSRCKEEAIFCIINELWNLGDHRAVFVVDKKDDWEKLSHVNSTNNIYIPRFFDDEIIPIENNTNIFVFTDGLPSFSKDEIELRPRMQLTLQRLLYESGMSHEEACKLVHETHGLYIPMKKKLFCRAYLKLPEWIGSIPDNILNTAVLIGQWTDSDGDKAVIEELSGAKYDEFKASVLEYSRGEDPFIHEIKRYSKTVYMLASAEITWEYIDIPNDSDIWKKFVNCIINIISESEKTFTYSTLEHIRTQIKGEKPIYSASLRDGMIRSVILKAYYKNDTQCQHELDEMVLKILDSINTEDKWRYFAHYFPSFCEISPLSIIERVHKEFVFSTGFLEVFEKQSENFMFEGNPYIDIVWGMEQFLTQDEYVSEALTWFLKLDNMNYNYVSNTPRDTLIKVFCPWYNFSSLMTVENKVFYAKKAFDVDQNAWDIIFESLPYNHGSILGKLHYPKYRLHINETYVTNAELKQIIQSYLTLLVKYSGYNTERWNSLISIADELSKENRSLIIDALRDSFKELSDDEKLAIHSNLRETIYKHRFYRSATWACNEGILHEYEELLKDIVFSKPEYGYVHLFLNREMGVILDPIKHDEDKTGENDKRISQYVSEQLLVFKRNDYDIELLAKLCGQKNSSSLGKKLAQVWDNNVFNPNIFKMLSKTQDSRQMALDYARAVMAVDNESFFEILDLSKKLHYDETHIVKLYQFQADLSNGIPEINNATNKIKRLFWNDIFIPHGIDYKWCLSECQKYGNIESYVGTLFYVNEKENLSPSKLLSYILFTEGMPSVQVGQMFDYYLKTLLSKVQSEYLQDESIRHKLSLLELRFYQSLEWDDMICFQKEIKQSPFLYAEMARLLFKSDKGETIRTEEEKKFYSNILRLYDKAKFCPGEENGSINESTFNNWVAEFRELLDLNHQSTLFGILMGRLLTYSPSGKDGFYPCEIVREFIEENSNQNMINSYQVEIYNRRGVFTPSAGKEEKMIAQRFKDNADGLTIKYPKTASIYYDLFKQYTSESQRERENAENGTF